jgi:hypothetical protein
MRHTDNARPLDSARGGGDLDGVPGGAQYHHDHPEMHNEDVAHEHSDVNIRAILMFAGGLVIVAVVVHFLIAAVFWWLETGAQKRDPQLSPLTAQAPEMPKTTTESPFFGNARGGAQLLTNEYSALQKLREQESKRLQGYGWVEGKQGVAHMPIEEAKKLILERGLPVRAGETLDATAGTRAAAMGEASGGRNIPVPNRPTQGSGAAPDQQQRPQQQHQPAQQPAAPHSGHQ